MSSLFVPSEVAGSLRPRKDATWLPQRAYVDQEIFDEERRIIFDKEWIGLFHHTSLPNVGDYRSLDVAGKPLLFVRDKSGELRCYINVCRHRGMAVAQGEGNCNRFVCPYHTWVYDLDGKVINRPLYDGNVPITKDTRLTEVRIEVFIGFVFINFDDNAEPLASKCKGMVEELSAWNEADCEVMFERTYPCAWNWKLMWENAMESYHVAGIHGESIEDDMPTRLAYSQATDPRAYTVISLPYAPGRNFQPPEVAQLSPIPNRPEWTKDEMRFFNLWPMSGFGVLKDAIYGYFVIPSDRIDECQVMTMYAVQKSAKANPDYETLKKSWSDYLDVIQYEDEAPCKRLQRTYEACDDWEPGPYAPAEATCWWFHNWYLQKMGIPQAAEFLQKMPDPDVHRPRLGVVA